MNFPPPRNQPLSNALILLAGASRPKPDFASIVEIPGINKLYHLVVAAADAKRDHSGGAPRQNDPDPRAQLAAAFHPTMILMVLLIHEQLPTQALRGPNLPDWCFTIGFIYDQQGVTFYLHTPKYDPPKKQWFFHSVMLDNESQYVFLESTPQARLNLVRKLLDMQRHAVRVRDHVLALFREKQQAALPSLFANLTEKYRP